MADNTKTIEIVNFQGRLTRLMNGDLNSGMARYDTSWGYDPFSKPGNLTWLEQPTDITGPITGLPLAAKNRFESGQTYVYMIDSAGKLNKIRPNSYQASNVDSVIGISSVMSNTAFTYGASIDFFGSTEKIYIGNDNGVNSINFDGSSETRIANSSIASFRPMKQFLGKLYFGDGKNVGSIDSTATPLFNVLSPALPQETAIQDIEISKNYDYLILGSNLIQNEQITTVGQDQPLSSGSDSYIFKWNGTDVGVTAAVSIPSYVLSALHTYLDNNYFFSNDTFGATLSNENQKILTLNNNKSPFPNAIVSNGNFLTWICPENSTDNTARYASLYYYGSLDGENPPGLFRVMRYTTTLASGFVYNTPLNILTNNFFVTYNTGSALTQLGYGKHYLSVMSSNNSGNQFKLLRFLITPTGTGTPQLGVYETQTQLFGKKQTVKQIRVYTEPTATGNSFKIDCIGSDGKVITNSMTNTYTFAAGTDTTQLQGALERIDFNPIMKDTYALGIRITNQSTSAMTIHKIEVDIQESGK